MTGKLNKIIPQFGSTKTGEEKCLEMEGFLGCLYTVSSWIF